MNLPPLPISFPGGASGFEPNRFRIVQRPSRQWLTRLVQLFPSVEPFFSDKSFVINAYPADLGLTGFCPSVESILHPPTVFSALQLAAQEGRKALFTAQPLVGADLLYRAVLEGFPLPTEILWGLGGYYGPTSMERFVRDFLAERGVKIAFAHSYGMGEAEHSILCAMDRFPTGEPKFFQIANHVTIHTVGLESELVFETQNGKRFSTGDSAKSIGDAWLIRNSKRRLDARVRTELESWGHDEWSRRTGYLRFADRGMYFQLRNGVRPTSRSEVHHHIFWHRFGGSFTMKPTWGLSCN